MNFRDNYFYKRITLAAGETSQPFAVRANTLMLKPYGSASFTDSIQVRFDNGSFSDFPSGVGVSFEDIDATGQLVPQIFQRVEVKNTGGGSVEFSILAFLGSSVDNNNMQIDGTIDVQGAGAPVAGAPISATVGGATKAISAAAKGILVYCSGNPVFIKNTSDQIIVRLDVGDFASFPFNNFTMKLVGDGGTAIVYVTEVI
jgi:hypothetical protein